MTSETRPLDGIRVIEFSHMVMGPVMGMVLADLGAEVIKVEPPGGDKTRGLRGSGAGYFAMYNRNKHSICIDLKSAAGRQVAMKLIAEADVLLENFRPGAMDRLGYGYAETSATNPGLVYCSARGFLAGPYEHRTALDEVTQMMGGLAYMTGPPGRPLRAGASVVDVTGGLFGVIAILAALEERHRTGRGQQISSALFETTAFLVGQHMAQYAVTGEPARPMPVRVSAWAVYDIFPCADGEQVFVAVVSDSQWRTFCQHFGLDELAADESLEKNAGRVAQRERIIPAVEDCFSSMDKSTLMARLDDCGVPYAPIGKPEDLFDDPHLNASGGLVDVTTPNGVATRLPALPVSFDGQRPGLLRDVPASGADGREILAAAGFSDEEIDDLVASGVVWEDSETSGESIGGQR